MHGAELTFFAARFRCTSCFSSAVSVSLARFLNGSNPAEPEVFRETGVNDKNVDPDGLCEDIGLCGMVGNAGMKVPGATCGGMAI